MTAQDVPENIYTENKSYETLMKMKFGFTDKDDFNLTIIIIVENVWHSLFKFHSYETHKDTRSLQTTTHKIFPQISLRETNN